MDFSTFKKLARKGNLIAVSRTIAADLDTPVSAFLKLAEKSKNCFLLESAEQEEKIGRYSIMGLNPQLVLSSSKNSVTIETGGKKFSDSCCHITDIMEATLNQYRLANPEALPGFSGGFVGYLSYENVRHFESVRLAPRKSLSMPEAIFFLALDFAVFDHFRKTLSIVSLAPTHKIPLKTAHRNALQSIEASAQKLKTPLKLKASAAQKNAAKIRFNLSKQAYMDKVKKIKSYIRAGDCIQTVLSQRFTLPAAKNDFQIYRALRSINPSPYMFYFRCGKYRLIGSSPELLVKKIGVHAEVRPIAGTRPRGKTQAEDLKLEENLKNSIKETAEHLMLVDLGRNDLGRVCEFDSIKVNHYAHVERYSHVMHLVSNVAGKLKKNKSAFDLLKAAFPAGTVSGAPKIRAMEIINELETEERGPYAGSLGYFGFNRDMDMCITIRTLFSDGKNLYLQAGAGIVKDSNPEKEYEETLNKAKALLKAIERQGEF